MAHSTATRRAPRHVKTHEPTKAQLAVAGRVGSRDGALDLCFLSRPFTVIDGRSETTGPARPALVIAGSDRITVSQAAAALLMHMGSEAIDAGEGRAYLAGIGLTVEGSVTNVRRKAGIRSRRVGGFGVRGRWVWETER